jgi:hypothetical protein
VLRIPFARGTHETPNALNFSVNCNDIVSETSVLWPVREPFTVRTDEDSEFYILSKADFESLIKDYSDVKAIFQEVSKQRMREWCIDDVYVPD